MYGGDFGHRQNSRGTFRRWRVQGNMNREESYFDRQCDVRLLGSPSGGPARSPLVPGTSEHAVTSPFHPPLLDPPVIGGAFASAHRQGHGGPRLHRGRGRGGYPSMKTRGFSTRGRGFGARDHLGTPEDPPFTNSREFANQKHLNHNFVQKDDHRSSPLGQGHNEEPLSRQENRLDIQGSNSPIQATVVNGKKDSKSVLVDSRSQKSNERKPAVKSRTVAEKEAGRIKERTESKRNTGRNSHKQLTILSKSKTSDVNVKGSKEGKLGREVPMSPEEAESLKALEERLREVKLYGAEKYETDPKRGKELRNKKKVLAKYGPLDSEQTKTLLEQLIDGTYDCMVCCERVRWTSAVWNCFNCYHIFHLSCIKKWAETSISSGKDPDGWRCPACQNVNEIVPNKYTCFCGKVTDPEWKPRDGITPHSCGKVCKKKRMEVHCSHPCTELCHPGPCPTCPVMINWKCPCGKTSYQIRCGQAVSRPCDNVCDKNLNCSRHTCKEKCHQGPCNYCIVTVKLACFCGKKKTEEICGSDAIKGLKLLTLGPEDGMFSCAEICGKTLRCGNHSCSSDCHPGDCSECTLLPEKVTHCPCGKTELSILTSRGQERESCNDPIPSCPNICHKLLNCGSGGKPHYCKMRCHVGPCGPCDGVSIVSCRCGANKKEVPCASGIKDREYQCNKICKKKRTCGRHRCNAKCCLDDSHICTLICGKKLQCGIHKCDELCHPGYCPRCWQTEFQERSCYCGKTVQYPPIPCGMPLPDCSFPCSREHDCEHPPQHHCHNEASCPPCTVLGSKRCMGDHESRSSIPCHIKDVSCGRKCDKPLPCGHSCNRTCHKGECLGSEKCQQPCAVVRKFCGHPCGAPCHQNEECPDTSCTAQVTVHCPCGRKNALAICQADNSTRENFTRFTSESIADKMHAIKTGQQIDIGLLKRSLDRLQCDEECAMAERNRRLADAFNKESEEGRPIPQVAYSYFLQQEAETNLPFIKMVEDTLEELILRVKKVEQPQLSHSFPPMTSTQRRVVHELAAHYCCRTQSYDQEPRRNTVVVATKESKIPPNRLHQCKEKQYYQPVPPKPLVLIGNKAVDLQSYDLKAMEKVSKKSFAPDYFDDQFQD